MTETAASSESQAGGRRLARKVVLTFVGALGFAAALTLLFYGMRSVMDIGGSCASGNTPFEIARDPRRSVLRTPSTPSAR